MVYNFKKPRHSWSIYHWKLVHESCVSTVPPRVAGPWRTFLSRIGLLLPYWLRVVILNYPRWEWLDKWLHHETITHITYHHLPHGQKKGPAITGHQVEQLCWAHLHDCADPISLHLFHLWRLKVQQMPSNPTQTNTVSFFRPNLWCKMQVLRGCNLVVKCANWVKPGDLTRTITQLVVWAIFELQEAKTYYTKSWPYLLPPRSKTYSYHFISVSNAWLYEKDAFLACKCIIPRYII